MLCQWVEDYTEAGNTLNSPIVYDYVDWYDLVNDHCKQNVFISKLLIFPQASHPNTADEKGKMGWRETFRLLFVEVELFGSQFALVFTQNELITDQLAVVTSKKGKRMYLVIFSTVN